MVAQAVAPRKRSRLITWLGGWMMVQGAFAALFVVAFLALLRSGDADVAQTASPLYFVVALLAAAIAALPLLIGIGLIQRRRWSYYLLVALWTWDAVQSMVALAYGTTLLPAYGGWMAGVGTSLGTVAFLSAFRLLLIYWLLSRRDEFR